MLVSQNQLHKIIKNYLFEYYSNDSLLLNESKQKEKLTYNLSAWPRT